MTRLETLLGCDPELLASDATRWYIVFCEVTARHWWDWVFRTPVGFSHCYALRWDGWNWIEYNPRAAYTDVAILPATSENALHTLVVAGATVVEVQAFRQSTGIRGRWWNGPMTCVEQIKALLGMRVGLKIWTPWQLYRHLEEQAQHGNTRQAQTDRPAKRARKANTLRARQINPRRK